MSATDVSTGLMPINDGAKVKKEKPMSSNQDHGGLVERDKALEEAARVCENTWFGTEIDDWMKMTKQDVSASACRECAKAIRSLKGHPTSTVASGKPDQESATELDHSTVPVAEAPSAGGVARGWQSMGSAPRDGTRILGINMRGGPSDPFVVMSVESPSGQKWADEAGWVQPGKDWPSYPTHWMPLPPPPGAPHSAHASSAALATERVNETLYKHPESGELLFCRRKATRRSADGRGRVEKEGSGEKG